MDTRNGRRPILITGGAGFIGTNLAERLLSAGKPVLIFDNLSRPGVETNLATLRARYPDLLSVAIEDVRDPGAVSRAVSKAVAVFHFAAQVAVTTSLTDPFTDFEINARGTFNVLEAVRRAEIPIVFTSTNKVYGALAGVNIHTRKNRYEAAEPEIRRTGINEDQPLSFQSPYGCSKGAADQYVLDYARSYRLPAVVFRMSCIYGPHQCGTEDQGWIAHFLIRALAGKPVTIYGDGRQVRDILYVEDLVDALLLARAQASGLAGQAFNIGGGASNTISLLELIDTIQRVQNRPLPVAFAPWRTGDQRYYVSDTRKFSTATGWRPKVRAAEGIERLYRWLAREGEAPAEPARLAVLQNGNAFHAGSAGASPSRRSL